MKCWWIFGHKFTSTTSYVLEHGFLRLVADWFNLMPVKNFPQTYSHIMIEVLTCEKCGKVKIRMVKI